VIEIPDAGHGELVFHGHNEGDDWAELPPDAPQGQETVRIILEAIESTQA